MRCITLLAGLSLLAGCATQGTNSFNYSPSKSTMTQNEKTVARAQSAVWDELVRELSKSFFVINNIERESRIINVSFNSNAPSDYVDCGRSHRTYTQGEKTEQFDYAIAEKSTYKIAGDKQANPSFSTFGIVNREPSLEGRSNIYVAPDPRDNTKTVVSVNTRYILTIRTAGEMFAQNIYGHTVERRPISSNSTSFIFNTNKPSTSSEGSISITCSGKGRLESDILNMVQ